MIRFRPHRKTPSAEAKDEQTFETMDEMFGYLFDRLNRTSMFLSSQPVHREDIVIDAENNVFVNWENRLFQIGVFE